MDTSDGGHGSDFYKFRGGWGQDTIDADASGKDTVSFRAITTGLTIALDDQHSSIQRGASDGGVNTLAFAGNFIENAAGGSGADTIAGSSSSNRLKGRDADDSIEGADGNDVIFGGKGDDELSGGADDDSYFGYAGASGTDTIDDAAGSGDLLVRSGHIASSDATLTPLDGSDADENYEDLLVDFGSGNTVHIKNYFDNTGSTASTSEEGTGLIENIRFSEGDFHFEDIRRLIAAGEDQATDDSASTDEDTPVVINVLGNDSGQNLSVQNLGDPANGTAEVITGGTTDDGKVRYTPKANYNNTAATADTFTYDACNDSNPATCDGATVSVTVAPDNDKPLAGEDTASMNEDENPITIDFATLVSDEETAEANLTYNVNIASQDAAKGTLGNVAGELTKRTFDSADDFNGAVEILYTVTDRGDPDNCSSAPCDAPKTSDQGKVTVTVAPVDDPPVAVDDSATAQEDAAATNVPVLTNDTDVDGGPKTISTASDPANGTVVITGGGSGLTYKPDANYCNDPPATNLDTFTYTLNGDSQGTVSMTVTCVNDAPVATDENFNGTNRAIGNTSLVGNNPSDGAPAPSGPKKSISGDILANDTDVDGPGPLAVQAGTFNTNDGGSVDIEADGDFTFHPKVGTSCTDHTDSFDYTLTDQNPGTAGTDIGTVTVEIQDCIWYVDSSAASNGDGRSHSPFNSLTGISGASGAGDADSTDQTIFLYDGTYSGGLRLENGQTLFSQRHGLVVSDGGSGNVTLEPAVPAGANTTITGGLTLGQNNTIQGIHLGNATEAALSGSPLGTATMNTQTSGAIDNQTGKAVDISVGTLNMAFTGVSSNNSSTDGIRLDNTAGTFNAAGGSLQNATDQDVDINGNNASDTVDFTYNGSISDGSGMAVSVANQSGGTKSFGGAIGNGSVISLANNGGATMNFSGPLTLTTGSSNAFSATGGGTVTVTDPTGTPSNKITTTTGTALNVANTTIGGNGLTFESISANGAPNGIVLNSTGSTAGLTVTGTSTTAGSGGTIQNITNRGASFISANRISLNNMNFTTVGTTNGADPTVGSSSCGDLETTPGGNLGCNAGIHLQNVTDATLDRLAMNGGNQQGINGNNVTNFVLSNSSVQNFGNETREDGLRFRNMLGTSSISNTTVGDNEEDQVRIQNGTGTLALTVSGNSVFKNSTTPNGGMGIEFQGDGSANMGIDVQSGTRFENLRSIGLQALGKENVQMSVKVNGSTFQNTGSAGMDIATKDSGDTTFSVTGNTLTGQGATAINVDLGGAPTGTQNATLKGTVSTNNISSPVSGAPGISLDANAGQVGQGGSVTAVVTGNTVSGVTNAIGIFAFTGDGAPTMNATITGNTVGATGFAGIYAESAKVSTDTSSVCMDIKNNNVANTAEIAASQRFSTTFRLPGYTGGSVATFLSGQNTLNGGSVLTEGTYTGGAACAQP